MKILELLQKLFDLLFKAIRWFYSLFKFVCDEQDKLCPVCGYHCTNKSAFCIPPNYDESN